MQLYHKLCSIVEAGGSLASKHRGIAIQLLPEHDPQLLALPFLALAPRSAGQAMHVVTQQLAGFSPPMRFSLMRQRNLVVVDPVSLAIYLKDYDATCELCLCNVHVW